MTAGSDIHLAAAAQPGYTFGVYLNKRMETIADYVNAVRANALAGLKYTHDRRELRGNERISLPLEALDENEQAEERYRAADAMEYFT
jgi:hypothetical protein